MGDRTRGTRRRRRRGGTTRGTTATTTGLGCSAIHGLSLVDASTIHAWAGLELGLASFMQPATASGTAPTGQDVVPHGVRPGQRPAEASTPTPSSAHRCRGVHKNPASTTREGPHTVCLTVGQRGVGLGCRGSGFGCSWIGCRGPAADLGFLAGAGAGNRPLEGAVSVLVSGGQFRN